MEEVSKGAIVPLVKPDPPVPSASASTSPAPASFEPPPLAIPSSDYNLHEEDEETAGKLTEVDKDFLCPICMQVVRDAFLTACGHSFCYMCIITHLRNKSDCPCCAHYLTSNHLFPNFLLQKKASARQVSKNASPVEQFRQALRQGCEVSIRELDTLLSLLAEKKRKMEQEEAARNMQVLLDFLQYLRKQKVDELNEYIKEDIDAAERHRIELYHARGRYSMKLRMLRDDPIPRSPWPSTTDRNSIGVLSTPYNARGGIASGSLPSRKIDGKAQSSSHGHRRKETSNGSDSQYNLSGLSVMRKKRINAQFGDLQECDLQKRRQFANQPLIQEERDKNVVQREGYNAGLTEFQSVPSTFTKYSWLRVIAELRHEDIFHSANIVSSIEFDRDDELFATAGVSRQIKVFDFSTIMNEPADVHCPVVEMPTLSNLSFLSWNKYAKNHIASSDYEGIVTVWDVTTRQGVMEYEEHEKRAWSVDFSWMEPSMLVSGSDDCKVGSADHLIHYYDLRNIGNPLHVFNGRRKAVSYVKFLSNNELASASTDSTLRLWDVRENLGVRTFRGHTNEKNFVGVTVKSEYIACGSETNEEISKAVTWHRFGSSEMDDPDEDMQDLILLVMFAGRMIALQY